MNLLQAFRGRTVEKIAAESYAITYSERRALVEQRDRVRSEAERELAPLISRRDAARATLERAKEAFTAAQNAAAAAETALITHGRGVELACARIDGDLAAGAVSRISEFLTELNMALETRRLHSSGPPLVGRNLKASEGEVSAYQRQVEHLDGIRQAIREAQALLTQAQTSEELDASLLEIRHRIPSAFAQAA